MAISRYIVRTRGNKVGQCNICGLRGPLTEDHSPPKSCVRPSAIQVRHLIQRLADEKIDAKGRISQNGLKFRTICARCNNDRLGGVYDPALATFTRNVSNLLNSVLKLPQTVYVPGQPLRIMRAVFGHLAAQGVERYKKGPKTDEFRDWFLDETAPLPEGIYFYYWPFPHQGSVIFRDAAILDLNTQRTNVIWLMKFFPIAFLVAWEDAHQPMFSLPRLCQLPSANPEAVVDIPVYLTNIPHKHWPEAPTDRTVVLYGQEAMFAVPHIK